MSFLQIRPRGVTLVVMVRERATPKKRDDRRPVFACRVRSLRENRAMSLRDLAKECGVPYCTVLRAERGLGVTLAAAMKLAAYFRIPVEQLWAPLSVK